MNLYLSSYRLGNSGNALAKWAEGKTALVISNALDFSHDKERLKFGREREINWLAELGIPAEAIDLRDYFHQQNDLQKTIEQAGMLWVVGGNTFLLRKAMKLSGLDNILHKKVDDPHFIYGGYSAGICVLSPSLKGIHLADEPEALSVGYHHETIWKGIGILNDYIVPHYRCAHWESESMEAVVDYYKQHQLLYTTIADGEVIMKHTHKRSN